MSPMDHVYVVILAGGGGTRLWPKSREKTPKQFLRLYTDNTLMQDAYQRAKLLVSPERILVVTNKDYVKETQRLLPEVPVENIVGEPSKKETAAAMLLGAMMAFAKDPKAIVINQASDHVVPDLKEFVRVMKASIESASSNQYLVTVGITPLFPHSGLGYIKIDEEVSSSHKLPVFRVSNFTEKPNIATAKAFISTGKYFWNANMYVWGAQALLDAFEKHMPETLESMRPIMKVIGKKNFASTLEEAYKKIEKISIDYAISEKATNLLLIPGDFGWNDIGDWKVVYDLQKKNTSGNVILSEQGKDHVICYDSQGNLIHSSDRLIALVGMNDTVVVDTGEILLVMPKGRSQDVKKIVEKLKEEKQEEYL